MIVLENNWKNSYPVERNQIMYRVASWLEGS